MKHIVTTLFIFLYSVPATALVAEFSVGDIFDRITILEIKLQRIVDQKKIDNICLEHELLCESLEQYLIPLDHLKSDLDTLKQELFIINEKLWVIEDLIRIKELKKEFDEDFIKLARSVYFVNDERCVTKRKINDLTGSKLKEEKQYVEYKQ